MATIPWSDTADLAKSVDTLFNSKVGSGGRSGLPSKFTGHTTSTYTSGIPQFFNNTVEPYPLNSGTTVTFRQVFKFGYVNDPDKKSWERYNNESGSVPKGPILVAMYGASGAANSAVADTLGSLAGRIGALNGTHVSNLIEAQYDQLSCWWTGSQSKYATVPTIACEIYFRSNNSQCLFYRVACASNSPTGNGNGTHYTYGRPYAGVDLSDSLNMNNNYTLQEVAFSSKYPPSHNATATFYPPPPLCTCHGAHFPGLGNEAGMFKESILENAFPATPDQDMLQEGLLYPHAETSDSHQNLQELEKPSSSDEVIAQMLMQGYTFADDLTEYNHGNNGSITYTNQHWNTATQLYTKLIFLEKNGKTCHFVEAPTLVSISIPCTLVVAIRKRWFDYIYEKIRFIAGAKYPDLSAPIGTTFAAYTGKVGQHLNPLFRVLRAMDNPLHSAEKVGGSSAAHDYLGERYFEQWVCDHNASGGTCSYASSCPGGGEFNASPGGIGNSTELYNWQSDSSCGDITPPWRGGCNNTRCETWYAVHRYTITALNAIVEALNNEKLSETQLSSARLIQLSDGPISGSVVGEHWIASSVSWAAGWASGAPICGGIQEAVSTCGGTTEAAANVHANRYLGTNTSVIYEDGGGNDCASDMHYISSVQITKSADSSVRFHYWDKGYATWGYPRMDQGVLIHKGSSSIVNIVPKNADKGEIIGYVPPIGSAILAGRSTSTSGDSETPDEYCKAGHGLNCYPRWYDCFQVTGQPFGAGEHRRNGWEIEYQWEGEWDQSKCKKTTFITDVQPQNSPITVYGCQLPSISNTSGPSGNQLILAGVGPMVRGSCDMDLMGLPYAGNYGQTWHLALQYHVYINDSNLSYAPLICAYKNYSIPGSGGNFDPAHWLVKGTPATKRITLGPDMNIPCSYDAYNTYVKPCYYMGNPYKTYDVAIYGPAEMPYGMMSAQNTLPLWGGAHQIDFNDAVTVYDTALYEAPASNTSGIYQPGEASDYAKTTWCFSGGGDGLSYHMGSSKNYDGACKRGNWPAMWVSSLWPHKGKDPDIGIENMCVGYNNPMKFYGNECVPFAGCSITQVQTIYNAERLEDKEWTEYDVTSSHIEGTESLSIEPSGQTPPNGVPCVVVVKCDSNQAVDVTVSQGFPSDPEGEAPEPVDMHFGMGHSEAVFLTVVGAWASKASGDCQYSPPQESPCKGTISLTKNPLGNTISTCDGASGDSPTIKAEAFIVPTSPYPAPMESPEEPFTGESAKLGCMGTNCPLEIVSGSASSATCKLRIPGLGKAVGILIFEVLSKGAVTVNVSGSGVEGNGYVHQMSAEYQQTGGGCIRYYLEDVMSPLYTPDGLYSYRDSRDGLGPFGTDRHISKVAKASNSGAHTITGYGWTAVRNNTPTTPGNTDTELVLGWWEQDNGTDIKGKITPKEIDLDIQEVQNSKGQATSIYGTKKGKLGEDLKLLGNGGKTFYYGKSDPFGYACTPPSYKESGTKAAKVHAELWVGCGKEMELASEQDIYAQSAGLNFSITGDCGDYSAQYRKVVALKLEASGAPDDMELLRQLAMSTGSGFCPTKYKGDAKGYATQDDSLFVKDNLIEAVFDFTVSVS